MLIEKLSNEILTVVIISKNEERNIASCIESVFKALKKFETFEVILVDSASSDNTIEIARKYPIKIIQLSPLSHLSPSAGRYIGFLHSHGNYIHFIDGDMNLCDDWLEKSIQLLKEEKFAGITGLTINNVNRINIEKQQINCSQPIQYKETEILAGAALFKFDILKRVGTYNPNLYGDEEAELSYRLRRADYKLLKVPLCMVIHFDRIITPIQEFKFRLNRKFYFGCGQTLRCSVGDTRLFLAHLFRFRLHLFFITWIIVGLLVLINSFIYDSYIFLIEWMTGTSLFIIANSIKKRSIKASFLSILSWSLYSMGIIIGFLIPPMKKELKYKVLKEIK